MSIDQYSTNRSHESPHDSMVSFVYHSRKPNSSSRCLCNHCTNRCDLEIFPFGAMASTSNASSGNAPIVSAENCALLDNVQRIADQLWRESGAEIAGDKGYMAIQLLSATNSHPAFPIFATALGSLPSLANGHSHMCACIAYVRMCRCCHCA